MKLLIQRAKDASITVEDCVVGKIEDGFIVYLGIGNDDTEETAQKAITKLCSLRLCPSKDGSSHFDQTIDEAGLSLLVVSQFTLYGNLQKGRRPSFDEAMNPTDAKKLYDYVLEELQKQFRGHISSGEFQAMMNVSYTNYGPLTFNLHI